jgi:hypothetical protein
MGYELCSPRPRWDPVASYFKDGVEPSGSIKGEEFRYQLSDCQLLCSIKIVIERSDLIEKCAEGYIFSERKFMILIHISNSLRLIL